MLFYSSTVGATVKTQALMTRSILEKENYKASLCSAELIVYNPSCVTCGNFQHSSDITGKIKNVLALIAVPFT